MRLNSRARAACIRRLRVTIIRACNYTRRPHRECHGGGINLRDEGPLNNSRIKQQTRMLDSLGERGPRSFPPSRRERHTDVPLRGTIPRCLSNETLFMRIIRESASRADLAFAVLQSERCCALGLAASHPGDAKLRRCVKNKKKRKGEREREREREIISAQIGETDF